MWPSRTTSLNLITSPCYRWPPGHDSGSWHHRGGSQTLGTQGLQGQVASQGAAGLLPDSGVPEPHLRVGARPPRAPQVRGHQRGPAQLAEGLLLLAHRLADAEEAQGCRGQGQDCGHE